MASSMVDMAKPKDAGETTGEAVEYAAPKYPYGTEMHLDHETLAALEAKNGKLPAVGEDVHIAARGKVTNATEDTMQDGTKRRSARIQLTHMGHEAVKGPDATKAAAAMYPSAGGEGSDE